MLSGLKDLKLTKDSSTFLIVFEEIKPPSLATLLRTTVGYIVLLCHGSPGFPFKRQHSSLPD